MREENKKIPKIIKIMALTASMEKLKIKPILNPIIAPTNTCNI